MTADRHDHSARRTKLWIALTVVLFLIALLVVPPLISINRYKSRIAQLISQSIGRPVRMSSVELRVLPRPGFLISELTVQEDPAFGNEPVLHASTVSASIRFSSLWRGHLEISRISVDEASLNLVRTPNGWNLDSLFRTAAVQPGAAAPRRAQLPYMEATNSRINIKNGSEKLPFSLLGADASLSRDSDGVLTVRLKGQPARTDVSLDLPDTGIVRLNATLHPAPHLRQMPIHLDLDWREAQLGQLSRLVLGSDEGWRGDLTGELHLDGNAESAQVTTRLRAAGVHRAEFAPAAPLDFDASCSFTYQYSVRNLQKLQCDSPIGDGRARLTAAVPIGAQPLRFTLELDRIPAQAGLDVLRTMRSNLDPTLRADGAISGRMTYDPAIPTAPAPPPAFNHPHTRTRPQEPVPGPLAGSFTVDSLRLSGDALSKPIQVAKMTLEPAPVDPAQLATLATTIAIPAGASTPLSATARLSLKSFQVAIHGPAGLSRLREFVRIAGGVGAPDQLAQLAGEPASVDLNAQGPWLPPVEARLTPASAPGEPAIPATIQTSGTITLHDVNWKPDFLANAVLVTAATLHIDNGALRWDPVAFSYGPVKGNATLNTSAPCTDPTACPPQFTVHFDTLDAGELQSALLGAQKSGTLLSTLLDRLKPSAPSWPHVEGTLEADTLILGPFTLTDVSADVETQPTGATINSLDASLLGGKLQGDATFTAGEKPAYTINGAFTQINPAQLGQLLLGINLTGGNVSGDGKLQLSGYTDKDLAGSASGTLHFDWNHGSVAGPPAHVFTLAPNPTATAGNPAPAADWKVPTLLAHFDHFAGDASIADGVFTLGQNQVQTGKKKSTIHATITFAVPARVAFGPITPPSNAPPTPSVK